MEAPNAQSSTTRHREDRTSMHDVWQSSFSFVPEESSLYRNGHQITYKDVMNPAAAVAPIQVAACGHTLYTSELGTGQMTSPGMGHMPNLVTLPNSAHVPKLVLKRVELEHRPGVPHVMAPYGHAVREPPQQEVCERAPQSRRARRPRGRPARRGYCQHRVVHRIKPSPQPAAQGYAQPAPVTRAQSPDPIKTQYPIRHAAPEMLPAQNQEHCPHRAPPHPATQEQGRRQWQNVNQGRHQRAAEYVLGITPHPPTNPPVTLMPIPPEHRVEMLPRELFNPPAFRYVVQKLHWTYLPKIAPVYGDPRQMPQAIEIVTDDSVPLRVPRPAHELRLSHIATKYSASPRSPPPFCRPVAPPLKRGGHQRTNTQVILMAERATNDIAASVAISLYVRGDPLSAGPPQHPCPQDTHGGVQAANHELPLNMSLGRREFCHPPGRLSQPMQVVTAATAGPSHRVLEVPQPREVVTAAGPSHLVMEEPQPGEVVTAAGPSHLVMEIPQPAEVVTAAGPSHLVMEIPQPEEVVSAASAEPSQLMEISQPAATGNIHAPVGAQQMGGVSWSTSTASHQLPSQRPAQHAGEMYLCSATSSHVLPKQGEVATWATAGPSYAPSQLTVPHTTISESQIPSQHAVVTRPIVDNSQVPTQHVRVSWPITGMPQVASQPKKEESWPVSGTSQSRTGTVITSQQQPQEAGHSQQIIKRSLQEWPTEEDFPPPKLSESSDDSSTSSDTINSHRRKQDKSNIVRQTNGC